MWIYILGLKEILFAEKNIWEVWVCLYLYLVTSRNISLVTSSIYWLRKLLPIFIGTTLLISDQIKKNPLFLWDGSDIKHIVSIISFAFIRFFSISVFPSVLFFRKRKNSLGVWSHKTELYAFKSPLSSFLGERVALCLIFPRQPYFVIL